MEKLCKVHAQYVFIGNPKFTYINTNYYIKFNCRQSTASLTETKAGNEASYKEDKNENFTQQHKE